MNGQLDKPLEGRLDHHVVDSHMDGNELREMPMSISERRGGARNDNPNWRHLSEVREAVEADSLCHWDTVVARDDLALKDGQLAFCNGGSDEYRLTPTNWATGQLCARLGIPAPYFRKCPTILQDVQMNYWLKAGRHSHQNGSSPNISFSNSPRDGEEFIGEGSGQGIEHGVMNGGNSDGAGKRWLLRARGETLRAVLSERYCALDNGDLMDALHPMLESRLRVDWFALSDEGLHLRIVDPNRVREVLPDDALSVGIHIANSEVGYRALTVDALVYRLVCSNGLIRLVKGKSLLRQRHIHIQAPRFAEALEEAIGAAWGEADGFIEQMRRTTLMPVDNVEETLEGIGERWSLSQSVQDDLLQSLRREPVSIQETVYGVVNAMTNVAQRQSDETRYDMEVLAGHLAQYGVDSFAPKRAKPKRIAARGIPGQADEPSVEGNEDASTNPLELPETLDPVEVDPVEVAIEMFEPREIYRQPVGRVPSAAGQELDSREMVALRSEEADA